VFSISLFHFLKEIHCNASLDCIHMVNMRTEQSSTSYNRIRHSDLRHSNDTINSIVCHRVASFQLLRSLSFDFLVHFLFYYSVCPKNLSCMKIIVISLEKRIYLDFYAQIIVHSFLLLCLERRKTKSTMDLLKWRRLGIH
jgi:hypothetical protein